MVKWSGRKGGAGAGAFVLGIVFSALLLMPYLNGHWRLADDAYMGSLPPALLLERILKSGSWPAQKRAMTASSLRYRL